ncbi:acyl CoA:acetate/3-ketoacid CoA transferase [Desulfosporosinus youngiae]|uniref:Acyl CoA:acetate/3-ketoacid CoA transferase n=1 Tax=Desulfosporosinus youngiae DSM 17734 TaxID=768710 RepID=H5Y3W3_9FIRM|nr:acyl CoA:acetate/3-ketoacid CoA transferase [Desulfosporosinus youngiae]EHQ89501.1 acyl CoA:acetate/3-ketoacid CoA transferase [Desulfosporosinus youngiae DSM 17734]
MPKVIKSDEVRNYVKDGDTIYTTGFGLGGFAEEAAVGIRKSFLETGHPRDLTLYYATGVGNFKDRGVAHFGLEGLLKRLVAGHFAVAGPDITKLVMDNKLEAYTLPQGVFVTMSRNIASKRPGILSKVGLGTFIDPRIVGGKLNQKAKDSEDLVELIEFKNEEWLYYKLPKLDVVLVRGSVADERGNISDYREGVSVEGLSAAMAAKACGGIVIAQVEHLVKAGSLHAKQVCIPGVLVDYVVVAKPEWHYQTMCTYFNPAFTGEIKLAVDSMSVKAMELDDRKIVCRRAAMELSPDVVVNLGIGMPDGVSKVCAEEKVADQVCLTTESGAIGGMPAPGLDFGHSVNAESIIGTAFQFDYYDGGGLDIGFLGMGQVDAFGNVNVSQFAGRPIGAGGFINITQNTKNVVFCGTFTDGAELEIADGKLTIVKEGKRKKFVSDVEQITFSGKYAAKDGQSVLYVTERAVFQLTAEGLELIEIAPGVDLEKDILRSMDFKPIIKEVKSMSPEIFQERWGKLAGILQSKIKN